MRRFGPGFSTKVTTEFHNVKSWKILNDTYFITNSSHINVTLVPELQLTLNNQNRRQALFTANTLSYSFSPSSLSLRLILGRV